MIYGRPSSKGHDGDGEKMKKVFNTLIVGALLALPMLIVFSLWAKDGMPY